MKNIIVVGTWNSGSGAVHDYLASRTDILSPFGLNEFKICSDPMGLNYLFQNCYRTGNNLLNPTHALDDFKKYINGFYKHKHYNKKGKEIKILDKKFVNFSYDFINNITEMKYYALPHYASLTMPKSEKIYLKIMTKIFRKKIKDIKLKTIIIPKKEKIFLFEAKKYIKRILEYYCNKKIKNQNIVLNNAADVSDPIISSQYFENRKIIIVTRDPRDIFTSMKLRESRATPWYNVNSFIKWYKLLFDSQSFKKKINNKLILVVKYESFLKDFKSENKRICKFLKINENFKLKNIEDKFEIKESIKNIGKSAKFLSKKEYSIISKSLKSHLQW